MLYLTTGGFLKRPNAAWIVVFQLQPKTVRPSKAYKGDFLGTHPLRQFPGSVFLPGLCRRAM